MAEERHFYGGQAIMEGVMMRGPDAWGAAVRHPDGLIVTFYEPVPDLRRRYRWLKWPLLRGNVALVETLWLGFRSLIFSFNVLVEAEEQQARQARRDEAASSSPASEPTDTKETRRCRKRAARPAHQADKGWALWLALAPSLALAIGLFVLLPTLIIGWLPAASSWGAVTKNLAEGIVRLAIILGYIAVIGLLPDIRRLFQYHGAEHATINCYEAGETISLENCRRFSPLHPRCGTAFLLVFIAVKIIIGAFFGWPTPWLRLLLRVAMIPIVAAIAYEIIRYGGRQRESWLARLLAQPGLLMQRLTTRRPDDEQLRVAIYALATVAPDVSLPADFPPPLPVSFAGKIPEEKATSEAIAAPE